MYTTHLLKLTENDLKKLWGFHHASKFCNRKVQICAKCSESNHTDKDCKSDVVKCINCEKAKEILNLVDIDCNHDCRSDNCRVLQRKNKLEAERIAYQQSNSIKGLYLNIGGISANFNQLEVLCLEEEFDFICLTETHLTVELSDAEFMLKNYNLVRCNSTSRHTGGVCFYIKKNWKVKVIECTGIDKQIWWSTIEIQNKNIKYILIGIHRSPDQQQSPEGDFTKFF